MSPRGGDFDPSKDLPLGKYRWKNGELVEFAPEDSPSPQKKVEIDPTLLQEARRNQEVLSGVDTALQGDQSVLTIAQERLEKAQSPLGLTDAIYGVAKSRAEQVREQEAKVAEAAASLRVSHFLKSQLGADGNPDLVTATLKRKVEQTAKQIEKMRSLGQNDVVGKLGEELELFAQAKARLDAIIRQAEKAN